MAMRAAFAFMGATQSGGIDQFDCRQGDLFGIIYLAELRDARIG